MNILSSGCDFVLHYSLSVTVQWPRFRLSLYIFRSQEERFLFLWTFELFHYIHLRCWEKCSIFSTVPSSSFNFLRRHKLYPILVSSNFWFHQFLFIVDSDLWIPVTEFYFTELSRCIFVIIFDSEFSSHTDLIFNPSTNFYSDLIGK